MRKHLSNPWVALSIILIAVVVIYSNIYEVPFVFDGVEQIEDKIKIRDLKNYLSPRVLLSPRPLVEFTFALNYKFGKLNVLGYHLVNVLIHIINGFLVYFLALTIFRKFSRLSDRKPSDLSGQRSKLEGERGKAPDGISQFSIPMMSLFTALIFVAHPIQTQAVTYTVQRYSSMAAMFYFLSIAFYIRARVWQQGAEGRGRKTEVGGRRSPRWNPFQGARDRAIQLGREGRGRRTEDGGQRAEGRVQRTEGGASIAWKNAFSFKLSAYFALSFVCGILAFLSKQNTASLPGAILLVEYLLFDRTWQGWKRKLLWFAPAFVLMGVFILYVSGLFRGGVQFGSLLEDVSGILRAHGPAVSPWIYLCTQLNVIVIYIRLLFLPVGQDLDYMYPFKTGFFDGYTPLAFLFLVAIVGLAIWNRKKRPIITFGIFWFFITLSIESSIFSITDALFEHRLYLPMFGFAIVVAYAVFYLLPVKRYWPIVISILIVLSLGTATYLRNRVWQSDKSLWSDSVAKNPKNYRAHINLGYALRQEGRFKEAVAHYLEALRLTPGYAVVHDNLGVALVHMGKMDDAMRHFSEALRIKPRDSNILTNYGQALMQQGKIQDAISYFSRALKIKPDNAKAHNNLGIALAQQGKLDEGIHHFSQAVRFEPHNAEIQRNLGQAFMLRGKLHEAVRHYSEAVSIKPEYAEAHSKLGVVLTRLNDFDGAIKHFSKALQIRPEFDGARQGLKRALRLRSMKKSR